MHKVEVYFVIIAHIKFRKVIFKLYNHKVNVFYPEPKFLLLQIIQRKGNYVSWRHV